MKQKINKRYLISGKMAAITFGVFAILAAFLVIRVAKSDKLSIYNNGGARDCTRIEQYEYKQLESYNSPQLLSGQFTFTLEELDKTDNYLCVYSKYCYIDIYIDNVLRHSMRAADGNVYGRSILGYWSSVPLSESDIDDEVRVIFYPIYDSMDISSLKAYVGASTDIYRELLLKDAPNMFVTILMIFAGLTFVCIAFVRSFEPKHRKGLIFLGLYGVALGTWGFTYTDFSILLLHKWILVTTVVNNCCLLLSVITFVWMMKYQMDKGKQKMLNIIATMVAAVYAVVLLLQITKVADIKESITVVYAIMLLAKIMVVMIVYIEAIQNKKNITQRRIAFTLLPCAGGLVLDLVMRMGNGASRIPLFFMSTVSIYLIAFGINIIRDSEEYLVGKIRHVEKMSGIKDDKLLKLSEELRAPLNNIDSMLMQLKKDVRHPERVLHYIEQIEESNDRMLEQINLIISETDEETMVTVEESAFDIRQLVIETKQIYAAECKRKKIAFEIECDLIYGLFFGDSMHLKKMLSHIILEALNKASMNARIHLEVDLGVTINEKRIVKFGIYVVGDKELYDLTSIEPLVDVMDGQVYIDSTKGEGILLIIEIPLLQLGGEMMD